MSKVPPECRQSALNRADVDRQEVSVIRFGHVLFLLWQSRIFKDEELKVAREG
jgi:hypothetical protein